MDFDLPEDLEAFRSSVRGWVDHEAPKDYSRGLERLEGEYPFELWDKMSTAGFHGIGIPEDYQGQGGDVVTQVVLARELARSLGALSWVWGLTSFAGSKSVGIYGSEAQKDRFLPAIARGELRFSIGFTEPGGGTDVLGALQTRAKKVAGGWIINGRKTWCTAAGVADYILLLVRTDQPVQRRHEGVSLMLLPAKSEGVSMSDLPKLGMRAISSYELGLEEVFVPDEYLLGEVGAAWHMLTPTLNNERIVTGALALGIIDGVLEDALEFVSDRQAFGQTIGSFQAIQHFVADIAMMREESELLVMKAAWLQANGRECFQASSMAKIVASENASRAADLGIQILGGMGFSAETNMQRYWRDSRLFRLAPVTNEMARNLIAERLGLPRSF